MKKEELLQTILVYGLISGSVVALLAALKSYFLFGPGAAVYLPMGLNIVLILLFFLYRFTQATRGIALMAICAFAIELIMKEHLTPVGMEIFFWFFTIPLMIFALFTPLLGIALSLLFLGVLLLLYHGNTVTVDPGYFLFTFYGAYIVSTIFMFVHRSIQLRHERKVEEQSRQLHHLNASLEQRIKEAIEKVEAQQKLLYQQSRLAQMGEMISMIAHQWRQPLAAISAVTIGIQTKIALRSFDLERPQGQEACLAMLQEKIDTIESHVQTLSQTIEDFRTLYRPDTLPEYTRMDQPMLKALSIMKSALNSRNVHIEQEYDETLELPMHASQMMQVCMNLIKNALDAFDERHIRSPRITITTRRTQEGAMLLVCDNAGGIDPEIIEEIFTPYFSTKSEKNGTGLGLYMSKMLVEEHHSGTLRVANSAAGACFKLLLPFPSCQLHCELKSRNRAPEDGAPPVHSSSAPDASERSPKG